jgi:hypothetical protein
MLFRADEKRYEMEAGTTTVDFKPRGGQAYMLTRPIALALEPCHCLSLASPLLLTGAACAAAISHHSLT